MIKTFLTNVHTQLLLQQLPYGSKLITQLKHHVNQAQCPITKRYGKFIMKLFGEDQMMYSPRSDYTSVLVSLGTSVTDPPPFQDEYWEEAIR